MAVEIAARKTAATKGNEVRTNWRSVLIRKHDRHHRFTLITRTTDGLELHVFEEKEEIVEGVIICPKCLRWYPIRDEIPEMLPDELREEKDELPFLRAAPGRLTRLPVPGWLPAICALLVEWRQVLRCAGRRSYHRVRRR